MNSVMLSRLAMSVSRLCKSFVFKFKAAEHRFGKTTSLNEKASTKAGIVEKKYGGAIDPYFVYRILQKPS